MDKKHRCLYSLEIYRCADTRTKGEIELREFKCECGNNITYNKMYTPEEKRMQTTKIVLGIGVGLLALYFLWDIRNALWQILDLLAK